MIDTKHRRWQFGTRELLFVTLFASLLCAAWAVLQDQFPLADMVVITLPVLLCSVIGFANNRWTGAAIGTVMGFAVSAFAYFVYVALMVYISAK